MEDQEAVVLLLRSRIQLLEAEVAQLKVALVNRDSIGMAKGILIADGGCTPDEAFDVLRRASQRENRKVITIAHDLIETRSRLAAWVLSRRPRDGRQSKGAHVIEGRVPLRTV